MSPTRRASSVPGLRGAVEAGGPPPDKSAQAATPTAGEGPSMDLPARPPKPVRFTLDLVRDQHRFLKTFALNADVDAARVMRALLDELRDDPSLAERVRAAVQKQSQ